MVSSSIAAIITILHIIAAYWLDFLFPVKRIFMFEMLLLMVHALEVGVTVEDHLIILDEKSLLHNRRQCSVDGMTAILVFPPVTGRPRPGDR